MSAVRDAGGVRARNSRAGVAAATMSAKFSFETTLRPGKELEYERTHSTTPLELDAVLRRAGARFWRIERNDRQLFHFVEADNIETFDAILDTHSVHLAWSAVISPLLTDDLPRRQLVQEFTFGRGRLVWELPSAPTGRLAARGIDLGPFSLGCAQLGNLYRAMSDETADAIVDAAWRGGIRHFDSAPHYGLGLSEQRLGRALRDRPRDQVIVSTKVGRMLETNPDYHGERDAGGFDVPAHLVRRWDFSADGVTRSIEASLERLGLDRLDLVFLHDPEENLADPDEAVRDALPTLERLRNEGMVGAIGVGTKSVSSLLRFVDTDIDAVMVAGRYTLVNQDASVELLPRCDEQSIDVVNAGVFNSGILASARPAGDAVFDYSAASEPLMERVNGIADLCGLFGTSVPRIALQFAAAHSSIRSVAFGADSADQVDANLRLAAGRPAPRELWEELVERDLLPAAAAEPVISSLT